MIRFGIRELRKGVLINLIVVLQTAVILVILFSIETAISSRYTYYEPIRDYISGDGVVCYFDQVASISQEQLKGALHGSPTVHISYKLFSETTFHDFQVYDNDLLEHYTPLCKEGEWVTKSDDPNIVCSVVYEKSGYHAGDSFTVKTETGEKTVIITGVMDDETLVFYFNYDYINQNDFRMLYANVGRFNPKILFLSASEADKLHFTQIASGISFIEYHNPLTPQELTENKESISMFGIQFRIDNSDLRENCLRYIYEQLRILSPVVISIVVLLLISLVCSNAVFASRQRRTFAIFEMLGLTRAGCLTIVIWKSLILSLISIAMVGIFLILKPRIAILDSYMIQFDTSQIVTTVIVVMASMLISVLITAITIRSDPYTKFKDRMR